MNRKAAANQASDISTHKDICEMVDTFYGRVREDKLLGPIFEEKIEDRWPRHLDIMYRFWQTILLDEHIYFGTPFPKHAPLPIDAQHFERWLSIFCNTVDELFSGIKADEAKWRAKKMAEMFQYKLDHLRKTGSQPLL